MRKDLPAVGTIAHLEMLSEHVPDQFINDLLPRRRGVGRRCCFSASQLWRANLLCALVDADSYNSVVRQLPEQRAWRRFAHLSHRERTPDVRMLYEFGYRAGVRGFRAINDHMVRALLAQLRTDLRSVALIDATDLPAATADKKKRVANGRQDVLLWAPVP